MRAEVERRLGYALPDYTLEPLDHEPADHLGVQARARPACATIGVPVHLGLISGDQMIARRRPGRGARRRRPRSRASRTSSSPACPGERRRRPSPRSPRSASRSTCNSIRGDVDRLHRRAALQLLGHRDEDAPRRADRAPRDAASATTSPSCASTSTAARTPARSTGSATSASRARPCATTRASATRPTTSSCAAASAPARRSARPVFRRVPTEELDETVERPDRRLARRPRARRELPRVLRPHDRRRARRPGRPRAGPTRRGAKAPEEEAA